MSTTRLVLGSTPGNNMRSCTESPSTAPPSSGLSRPRVWRGGRRCVEEDKEAVLSDKAAPESVLRPPEACSHTALTLHLSRGLCSLHDELNSPVLQGRRDHASWNFNQEKGKVTAEWFKGWQTNMSYNCLDRCPPGFCLHVLSACSSSSVCCLGCCGQVMMPAHALSPEIA